MKRRTRWGVDWTHQWIVDGHWRNQPYGVGHSLRRLQWIAPFIKGPEDAPLVIKDKVMRGPDDGHHHSTPYETGSGRVIHQT